MLGGELAVPCTRNPLQRGGTPTLRSKAVWRHRGELVLTSGSCAAEGYESRQVRKEATVNSRLWVPQECLL